MQLRHGDLASEFRLANLAFDLATIDSKLTEICQQLVGAVLLTDETEKLGGIINECGPAISRDESVVGQQRGQEWDICLDATNLEFHKGTDHLSASNFVCGSMASALGQHAVIEWRDDSTGKPVAGIKANSVSACRAVHLDLARVRGEALGGIFSGDSALDSKASDGDALLRKTELLQSCASGNLNLRGYDINTGDFFCDRVLDLARNYQLDLVYSRSTYIRGLISMK